MNKRKRGVVVCASVWTGSDLVVDMIDQGRAARCYGEVFHPNPHQRVLQKNMPPALWDGSDPCVYYKDHMHEWGINVGFKLIHTLDDYDFGHDRFRPLLHEYVKTVVICKRRNLLHQWISLELALRRGLFRSEVVVPDSDIVLRPTFHTLLFFFRWIESYYAHLDSMLVGLDVNTVDVVYEDLVDNLQAYSWLMGELEISPGEYRVRRQKLNNRHPSDVLINFDELSKEFSQTRYERFFT